MASMILLVNMMSMILLSQQFFKRRHKVQCYNSTSQHEIKDLFNTCSFSFVLILLECSYLKMGLIKVLADRFVNHINDFIIHNDFWRGTILSQKNDSVNTSPKMKTDFCIKKSRKVGLNPQSIDQLINIRCIYSNNHIHISSNKHP